MISIPPRGIFVTGTDTEVGKTYVACLLIKSLLAEGLRVGAYKPVASGGRLVDGRCICEDAEQLWQAAGKPLSLQDVCPQMFLAPLAPQVAAREEGTDVDRERLLSGLAVWRETCDVVVIEGVGGYFSPVAERARVADLAVEWGYPVLVVSANRLGTINHTLLTLLSIESYRGGLPLAGVILNDAQDKADDLSRESNWQSLQAVCPDRLVAHIRHGEAGLPSDQTWSELLSKK